MKLATHFSYRDKRVLNASLLIGLLPILVQGIVYTFLPNVSLGSGHNPLDGAAGLGWILVITNVLLRRNTRSNERVIPQGESSKHMNTGQLLIRGAIGLIMLLILGFLVVFFLLVAMYSTSKS